MFDRIAEVNLLYHQKGKTISEIALLFGVGVATVHRATKRAGRLLDGREHSAVPAPEVPNA